MKAQARVSAVIVAGGKSTRLGRDKASESLLGVPMLQRVVSRIDSLFEHLIIVKAQGQSLPHLETPASIRVVEDRYAEVGPLGGIYTGLSAADAEYIVALACDMPLLQPALVGELIRLAPDHDIVVPLSEGFPQPLCAAYGHACLGPIRDQIESGNYKITGFFGRFQPLYLQPDQWRAFDADGVSFMNLNREEDLRLAEQLLRAEETGGRL